MNPDPPLDTNNIWYLGEGIQTGTYVQYSISRSDANMGLPFIMTIWFKEQNRDGNWIVPVEVIDQGKTINGTFILSKTNLTILDRTGIPGEMGSYINAYSDTLTWLSTYIPPSGRSLSTTEWDRTDGASGPTVALRGKEDIAIPGGIFNTTVLSYDTGSWVSESIIWIKDGFPYPVKAQTFRDVASSDTADVPIDYAFELQKSGVGTPPILSKTSNLE